MHKMTVKIETHNKHSCEIFDKWLILKIPLNLSLTISTPRHGTMRNICSRQGGDLNMFYVLANIYYQKKIISQY